MSELSDLLERFRRGAELLAVATTGAAGPELDFHRGEGKLSVRQIACHLADAEIVGAMRIRQIIAEENPVLQYFDDDAWAVKLDYHKRKISQALDNFRRLRSENYELLKDLEEPAFARTGMHSKGGSMSLRQVVAWYAQHLEDHVREIQSARMAFKESKAKTVSG